MTFTVAIEATSQEYDDLKLALTIKEALDAKLDQLKQQFAPWYVNIEAASLSNPTLR